jgi:hypothetical protein
MVIISDDPATHEFKSTQPSETPQSGFPLAALALLVTAFACVLACIDMPRWRIQYAALEAAGAGRTAEVFVGAVMFGGIVGIFYSVRRRLGWRTLLTSPLIGGIAGAIGVVVLLAPGSLWRTVLAVAVLLASAVVFRWGAD